MTSPTAIRTQGVIRRAAMELAVEKPVDEVTVDDIAE
ncbi:MAG: TetR family transcriptional regulator, partial [Cutibacterium avidum]|nr:TetR family transcriptional regulator [Cutibacterium avidum]